MKVATGWGRRFRAFGLHIFQVCRLAGGIIRFRQSGLVIRSRKMALNDFGRICCGNARTARREAMRLPVVALFLTVVAPCAMAQAPADAPPAAPAAPVDPAVAAAAAAAADQRAKEDMEALLKAQERGPEPTVVDPGRAEREKAWTERCNPRLVAAADGMQRYVYAFPDCAGRELSR
jgi:hypothetical protein